MKNKVQKTVIAAMSAAILATTVLAPANVFAADKTTPSATGDQIEVTPMYRLYNPNSGEHFYTLKVSERDNLKTVGWTYEGIGWYAPTGSDTPVYRLYNPNAGDHFYTESSTERDSLVEIGWKDEGIGWYSDDNKEVALYREYNPNAIVGTHNYTTSQTEDANLVKAGWNAEGKAWYGCGYNKDTNYRNYDLVNPDGVNPPPAGAPSASELPKIPGSY